MEIHVNSRWLQKANGNDLECIITNRNITTTYSPFPIQTPKIQRFLEGNLQNAHNSKVLNIPNIFFGVLSIASSWKAHYRVANLPTELGCQLWSDSKCLVNYLLLFVCIQSVADTATGSCDSMSQKVAHNFPNSSCNYILDTCLKL